MRTPDLAARGVYSGGKRRVRFDVVGEGNAKRLLPNVEEQPLSPGCEPFATRWQSFVNWAVGKPPIRVKCILVEESGHEFPG